MMRLSFSDDERVVNDELFIIIMIQNVFFLEELVFFLEELFMINVFNWYPTDLNVVLDELFAIMGVCTSYNQHGGNYGLS